MDLYLLDDDVVVHGKDGVKGTGGSRSSHSNGARGGSKRDGKRAARQNKHQGCYSSKYVRIQAAKAESAKSDQLFPATAGEKKKGTGKAVKGK
jgi:hypothetical protein